MLKKSYLLVAALSFMVISPAFSMESEDERSSPISTEESHKEKTPQVKEVEVPSPSSQQDTEKKASSKDLKEDSSQSAKPFKQRRSWCCFRKEDND